MSERLSPDHLAALARLAGLDPDAADREVVGRRLERVLTAVQALEAAALDGVPPTFRAGPPAVPLREDDPTPWRGPDPLPEAAPRTSDGGVRTPAPRAGEEAT